MNSEEMRPVREWLHEHRMEIIAMSAGENTVTIDVHPPDGTPRKLQITCDFLRGNSRQQIKDYLESQHCATELVKRDVHVGRAS